MERKPKSVLLAIYFLAGLAAHRPVRGEAVPGATIVIPSFEVSYEGPTDDKLGEKKDTAITLRNVSADRNTILAMRIYSRSGAPVTWFNVPLRPADVVTFTMARILKFDLNINPDLQKPGNPDVCKDAKWYQFQNPDPNDRNNAISIYSVPAVFPGAYRTYVLDGLDSSFSDNSCSGSPAGDVIYTSPFLGFVVIDVVNYCTNWAPNNATFFTNQAIATLQPGGTPNVLVGSAVQIDKTGGTPVETPIPVSILPFDPTLSAASDARTFYSSLLVAKDSAPKAAGVPAGYQFRGDGRVPGAGTFQSVSLNIAKPRVLAGETIGVSGQFFPVSACVSGKVSYGGCTVGDLRLTPKGAGPPAPEIRVPFTAIADVNTGAFSGSAMIPTTLSSGPYSARIVQESSGPSGGPSGGSSSCPVCPGCSSELETLEVYTNSQLVPIVLDVTSGTAHYTTELALTNRTSSPASVQLRYTASLGTREGSGAVTESLSAGEQKQIADVIAYLRGKGLAIPPSTTGAQGGTLQATFTPSGTADLTPESVSVMARTTTATEAPQPVGSAGLAYGGVRPGDAITTKATLYGLRANASDRTNVALFNPGSDSVTVKVTVFSGDGSRASTVYRSAETIPPLGWLQYSSSSILGETGVSNGWVTVERVSTSGSFGAYAVINDQSTNDGSFLTPVVEGATGSSLTVPILVEVPGIRSELVLSNRGMTTATLALQYTESITPSLGPGGPVVMNVGPGQQLILPEAVDELRKRGVAIGTKDAASYAGALRIAVSGASLSDIFAGARTAFVSPAGAGQFGTFTPGVYAGQEAAAEAYLFGLKDDATNRSNVAVLNAGPDGAGAVTLQLQAFEGGVAKGSPESVTLAPGQWKQFGKFLAGKGASNGWVSVTRTAGTAPWIAYGIINDGASAGERTGDGSYVPMVK